MILRMKFDAIKHGKVISHFYYDAISTGQLIELHRLGYHFELSSNQGDNLLASKQAGVSYPDP